MRAGDMVTKDTGSLRTPSRTSWLHQRLSQVDAKECSALRRRQARQQRRVNFDLHARISRVSGQASARTSRPESSLYLTLAAAYPRFSTSADTT